MSHNVIYVDQPDLALPRTMYLDTESYADYIAAYKTFMLETAMVMARYVMIHYLKNKVGVVDFTKAHRVVKFHLGFKTLPLLGHLQNLLLPLYF